MTTSSRQSSPAALEPPALILTPCTVNPDSFLQPGEDPLWHLSHTAVTAVAACQVCPRLTACAQDGATAGTTADRKVSAVADGVIQAGIVCRGDATTRRQLRAIATGRTATDECAICERPFTEVTRKARGLCSGCYTAERRELMSTAAQARNQPPAACVDCDKPMTPFGRDRKPGFVEHRAAGRCHACDMRYRRRPLRLVA